MTPDVPGRGNGTSHPVRHRRELAGCRSSSPPPRRDLRHLLGDDPDAMVRDLQDRFPKAELIGGDTDFEQLVARVVGFLENPSPASICRSTSAAPRSSNGSGRHCVRFRPARPRATPKSPGVSASRNPCEPWPRLAGPTISRSPSLATGSCGPTGACQVTAGASNGKRDTPPRAAGGSNPWARSGDRHEIQDFRFE